MDKLKHPNYTEDMGWYPEKPFELRHVYDVKKQEYVTNELQCCYYSNKSNHNCCTHKNDCILKDEKWEYYNEKLHPIVSEIKNIHQLLKDYENIKQGLLNNEIIYHENFEEYYTIHKEKKITDEGIKYNVIVSVVPNFKNIINNEIRNMKLELRQLNKELLRLKRRG